VDVLPIEQVIDLRFQITRGELIDLLAELSDAWRAARDPEEAMHVGFHAAPKHELSADALESGRNNSERPERW
jgi:hypothetical protein